MRKPAWRRLLLALSLLLWLPSAARAQRDTLAPSPWDLAALSAAPERSWLDESSPIRSLTYRGTPYEGQATDVFAFYATPGTIAGDPARDRQLPAVVLVHGGGGTAFAEWVWLWAQRGYAALAMDLSGRRPAAPTFDSGQLVSNLGVQRVRLARGGPEQGAAEKFSSVGGDKDDDWPYHAVANVILAHSLLRSFPEVDAERTAVTGISWGGYTTCLVASIDDRFRAAVPVYGCGFLFEGESVQKRLIDQLPAEQRALWIAMYDPSSHLAKCRVPMLFVNGTNDQHYPLNSYARSFALVAGAKQMRLEVNMRHSHVAGWEPREIGLFVDHYLRGSPPLPRLGAPQVETDRIVVPCESVVPVKSAALHYTTDRGPLVDRAWQSRPASIGQYQIVVEQAPPAEATLWMIAATDERDAMVSTDVVFVDP